MIHFGTDGWRAVIADEFTFANVKVVAQAISDHLHSLYTGEEQRVAVGYDARFLSQEFARTVACVLAANGIRVVLASEYIPSPLVSFVTREKKCRLGIMITASHNPYQFNGLKIKTPDGGAADTTVTDAVEKWFCTTEPKELLFEGAVNKKLIVVEDFSAGYLVFLKEFVNYARLKELKVRVLVDLMHGSGGNYLWRVLAGTAVNVEYMHGEFNPSFEKRSPEPLPETLPELIQAMKKGSYQLGIALDGDGDRVALVTPQGEFISAQVILPLLAQHMIQNRKQTGGIAKTVVGSNLIDRVALALKVELFETAVGFKYISNLFKQNAIAIGGEEAGGLGYKGFIPERDGNMSALLVLEMMSITGKSFSSLVQSLWDAYGKWYYDKIKISLEHKKPSLHELKIPGTLLGDRVLSVNRVDGTKIITPESWLMFRQSGTEPIVRIYAESMSAEKTARLLALGKKMIEALF